LCEIARSFATKQTAQNRIEAETEVQNTAVAIKKLDAHIQDYEARLQEIEHMQAEKELVVAKLEANLTILKLRKDIFECKNEIQLMENTIKGMSSSTSDLKHTYQECEDNKQVIITQYFEGVYGQCLTTLSSSLTVYRSYCKNELRTRAKWAPWTGK
jgi:chromosome segregation ATPase